MGAPPHGHPAGTGRRSIRVTGRVQGVSFRAYVADEARRLGLTGFVRNDRDGSVLIEAEGESAALDRLVAWCHRGSPSARVTGVEVASREPIGSREFAIRR